MMNIRVQRYLPPVGGWAGWVEPEDRSWILFVDTEGKPLFFPHRDQTGATVGPPAGVEDRA